MKTIDRRTFLKQSAAGLTGAVFAGPALAQTGSLGVLGANERVQLALAGAGGRGLYLARFMISSGAQIAAVCDLHPERANAAAREIDPLQDRRPSTTAQLAAVLSDPSIDAVIVATPDHWHALATILACQAGKDVYVEKPHSHNIWESRQMIQAARKYNRVVQVGTQNRSAPYNQAARDYIQSGKLGRIHLVKVFNLKSGDRFVLGEPGETPAGLDWDEWLGPAPARPYHQRIFQGGWHHFWDFSGGDLADDAAHQIDLAMMLMGETAPPRAISCSGGRLAHAGDDSEVPDLQVVAYDFKNFVMTLEHSNYPKYMEKTSMTIRRNDLLPYWTTNATRIELYGSELLMTVGRHGGGWVVQAIAGEVVDKHFGRPSDLEHAANFIACVKNRQRPNADLEILHPSCCMLHLANIAYRMGNVKLSFDPEREAFPVNDRANTLLRRDYRKKYRVPERV